ncbi:hypothetical protein B0H14DRAFT_2654545 [Mycena olivaceomarginata]|nr:hypothetical protein B0H14DRAFT_2654545 [Mycena olivaceomarginata]
MASSGFTVSVPSFTIEYITTVNRANECLRLIRDGMSIRFDVEWTSHDEPGAKRKTPGEHNAEKRQQTSTTGQFTIRWELVKLHLLQIYWGNGTVYIIDLPAMKEVPHELERVCASSAIIKAGTGLFSRISRDDETPAFYSELVGLADVAEHVCGMKLDKSQRETDWSKSVLSSEQLQCFRAKSTDTNTTYPVAWFMFDVVGNTRVQAGTAAKWKADCNWWSSEPGVGFVARR